jgi:CRP-like cAMP-binding protein
MSLYSEENNQEPEMRENFRHFNDMPFFSAFPQKAIKLLAFLAQRASFSPGDIVFEEGEDFSRAYYIISGELTLYKKSGTDKTAIQKYGERDFLGSFSLLGAMPSLYILEASAETTVLTIEREQFAKILEQFPETGKIVVKHLLRELYQWERKNITRAEFCCLKRAGATVL